MIDESEYLSQSDVVLYKSNMMCVYYNKAQSFSS